MSRNSTWRNIARMPKAGIEEAALDLRIIFAWVPLAFTPKFIWLSALVTVLLLVSQYRKQSIGMMIRRIKRVMVGSRKGGHPVWRNSKTLPSIALAAMIAIPVAAEANFIILSPPGVHASVESDYPGPMNEMMEGFGQDVPMVRAVNQILPDGWRADYDDPEFMSAKVSWWSKGEPRGSMLEHLADQAGAKVEYDVRSGRIRFVRGSQRMTAESSTEYAPEAPEAQIYTLRAGSTLSKELERWSQQSESEGPRWHVRWDLDYDYEIHVSASFFGPFQDAVSEVVDTYRDHGGLDTARVNASTRNNVVHFFE